MRELGVTAIDFNFAVEAMRRFHEEVIAQS
jgi:hypothetical protein